MSLLVFFPGALGRVHNKTLLDDAGLAPLYDDDTEIAFADVLDNGPDGGTGILCGLNVPVLFHAADKQEWHECSQDGKLEAGRAWIGWFKNQRPTPETLARKKQFNGELTELNDGNEWLIPIAKQLPHVLGRTREGKAKLTVAERYRAFFERSYAVLEMFMTAPQGEAAMTYEEAQAYGVQALAINYRVTVDLVVALELITTDLLWTIPEIVTEFRKMIEVLKKNGPHDMPSTGDGESG